MHKKILPAIILFLMLCSLAESITYYGQVLLRDRPVDGLDVTAEWLDDRGIYHSVSTSTLTLAEAQRRGDPLVEGYYFFDGGEIYPMVNTNVVFSFGKYPYNILSRVLPGQKTVKIDTISFRYTSSYSNESANSSAETGNYSLSHDESLGMILSNVTAALISINGTNITDSELNATNVANTPVSEDANTSQIKPPAAIQGENKKQVINDVFVIISLVVLIALFMAIGYFFLKKSSVYIEKTIDEIAPVAQKSKKILDTKIKPAICAEISISHYDKLENAFKIMEETGEKSIFVTQNDQIICLLNEMELLKVSPDQNLKIKEIKMQKEDIIIEPKKTLKDAALKMAELDAPNLAVKEDNKIIGQIKAYDIMRQLSGIKMSEGMKNRQDIPLVRDIIEKECPCLNKDAKAKEIREIMLSENSDIVLIKSEKFLGEVICNDLISGIARNGLSFLDNNAAQIMGSVHSVNPDMDLFEANEYILERGFSSYPVIINDTLLGVIKPLRLLKEITKYMQGK